MLNKRNIITFLSCVLSFTIPVMSWGCIKADILSNHAMDESDISVPNRIVRVSNISGDSVSKQNCIMTNGDTSCVMSATGSAVNQNYNGSNDSQIIQIAFGSNRSDNGNQTTVIRQNVK